MESKGGWPQTGISGDNPDPERHIVYVLTYKWILARKYRIPMLFSTDPKKLKKKEGTDEDA